MKKHSFDRFDTYIDYFLGMYGEQVLLRTSQILGSLFIVVMTAVCTAHFVMYTPLWHTRLIQGDLNQIAHATYLMDHDCGLQELRTGRHPIKLLTQKTPPESVIELSHPENWRGPYLHKVLTLQGKPYELLKTKNGLYVVPGNGVKLPSGAVIGDTFSWCANTDMNALSQSGGILFYQSAPLVRRVDYQGRATVVAVALPEPAQTVSDDLQEFAAALTFAQNEPQRLFMHA